MTINTIANDRLPDAASAGLPIRRLYATDTTDIAISGLWERGLKDAGFAMAFALFNAQTGNARPPSVLVPKAESDVLAAGMGRTLRSFGTQFGHHPSTEAALGFAREVLHTNPEDVPHQVGVFDSGAGAEGSTERGSLTIELHCYGGSMLSARKALTFTVACRYQRAPLPQGLTIFSPRLLECSAPKALYPVLFKHFYLGIYSFRDAGFAWNSLLDESA
jgi:hypothetical protein